MNLNVLVQNVLHKFSSSEKFRKDTKLECIDVTFSFFISDIYFDQKNQIKFMEFSNPNIESLKLHPM